MKGVAWIAVLGVSMGAGIAGQAPPRFKTAVEVVRVDVLATKDEVPVSDLRLEDFEVRDNGVRQQIDAALPDEEPIDLVLALDTSGSLDATEMTQLAGAARAALDRLTAGDRAAVIAFSHVIREAVPLSGDLTAARAEVARLSGQGGTALFDATYAGLLTADALDRRSLVLVFTDGLDTASWLEPDWVLEVARRSAAVVYTVGVREASARGFVVPLGSVFKTARMSAIAFQAAATRFLTEVAEVTGGRRLDADNLSQVQATFAAVLREFRQRHVLTYTPTGVPQAGWHEITVRVKRRGVEVRARRGYWK